MHRFHLIAVFLCACGGSAGFQQPAPRMAGSEQQPPVVNDDDVARAFALRAQLPKPYRLGVLFREPSVEAEPAAWRWEPEHRAQLLKALEALEGRGEIAAVLTIARTAVVGDDLHAIRVAAARQGADAVLIVSGDDTVERGLNGWATSYIAVLPMFFAPGSELRVDFAIHAELWDVRNEYLYLAAEAEARSEQMRAWPYIDTAAASSNAQSESLGLLIEELRKRFGSLHGAS